MSFAAKLAALELGDQLAPVDDLPANDKPARGKGKQRPTGRRQLSELDLPEERIEVSDPALEGTAPRMGTEDSCKLMWRRGGFVRI